MHFQGVGLGVGCFLRVLDAFSGCWLGVGCFFKVFDGCWMHFLGVGWGVECFFDVLDAFSGCWMRCLMLFFRVLDAYARSCFGQHRVGYIFRVLDGLLDALFDCFIQHLFGWCWMGVWSVNIRIKINWCWAGIGWTNIQISGKIQLGKYWMQSVGQNTSTFAGMHLFA